MGGYYPGGWLYPGGYGKRKRREEGAEVTGLYKRAVLSTKLGGKGEHMVLEPDYLELKSCHF